MTSVFSKHYLCKVYLYSIHILIRGNCGTIFLKPSKVEKLFTCLEVISNLEAGLQLSQLGCIPELWIKIMFLNTCVMYTVTYWRYILPQRKYVVQLHTHVGEIFPHNGTHPVTAFEHFSSMSFSQFFSVSIVP